MGASLLLESANNHIPADLPVKTRIQRVLDLMRSAVDDGRKAVRGLRTSKDVSQNLEQAFSHIPRELALQNAAEFLVIVEGSSRDVRPLIRDEVYCIGREAVANALRHSGAAPIELPMQHNPDELRILLRDNGKGIGEKVLSAGREGHGGLAGMRERPDKIGATLRAWSGHGVGTEVELEVPGRIAFENSEPTRLSRWLPGLLIRREAKPAKSETEKHAS